jgi:hypothetical protein
MRIAQAQRFVPGGGVFAIRIDAESVELRAAKYVVAAAVAQDLGA